MEKSRKRIKYAYNESKEFLIKNASLTKIDDSCYNSVRNTMFFQNPETHTFKESNTPLSSQYLEFMSQYNFPIKLKLFWVILGNENDEIKTQTFTIMNLKQIVKDKDNYNGFIDIGIHYLGMGHVIVLSLDKVTGGLFLRRDGGSNGYERAHYLKYYKNKKPYKNFKNNIFKMDDIMKVLSGDEPIESLNIVSGY